MKIAVVAAGFLAASFTMARPAYAQDATAGERLFRQRCAACHTVQPGQNRVGPHLSGVVGRKPGSVEGARYSKGLSALETSWDAANLDAFLSNPRAVAPGTTMALSVPNAADRSNIVAYLQGLTTAN
jgi:cytochrome c